MVQTEDRNELECELGKLSEVHHLVKDKNFDHSVLQTESGKILVDSKAYLTAYETSGALKETVIDELVPAFDKLQGNAKQILSSCQTKLQRNMNKSKALDGEIEVS